MISIGGCSIITMSALVGDIEISVDGPLKPSSRARSL